MTHLMTRAASPRPIAAVAPAPLAALQAASANAASATKGSAPTHDIVVISHARAIDPEAGLDAIRNIGITGDRFAAISTAPIWLHVFQ